MSSHTWGIDEFLTAPEETRNLVRAWLVANVGAAWGTLGVRQITLDDNGTFTIEHVDYVKSKHTNHPVPRAVKGDDGEWVIAGKLLHGHMVTPFPIVFTDG